MAAAGMAASLISGAEADAVYDATYNKSMAVFNAGQNVNAVETQMANIKQEQILGVANVALNQDAAEAQAKVNAAAAGVSGGSVEQVIYETNKDAAFAVGNINAQADADTQALFNDAQSASLGLASANSIDIDVPSMGESMVTNTLELGGAYLSMDKKGKDDFNKMWSD
jgi:hypothetical protein